MSWCCYPEFVISPSIVSLPVTQSQIPTRTCYRKYTHMLHICTHLPTHICNTHAHTHMHVSYTHMLTPHKHTHIILTHAHTTQAHAHTHTHTHAHVHTHACTHTHTHALMHMCTHTHALTHTHTLMHTCTHTHTHTQAHTCMHSHTFPFPPLCWFSSEGQTDLQLHTSTTGVIRRTKCCYTQISLIRRHLHLGLQADDGARAQKRDSTRLIGSHQKVRVSIGIQVKATR